MLCAPPPVSPITPPTHTPPPLGPAQDDKKKRKRAADDGWDSDDSDFEDLKVCGRVGSMCVWVFGGMGGLGTGGLQSGWLAGRVVFRVPAEVVWGAG